MIDMMRGAYTAYFDDDNLASNSDLLLLCMAVGVGQMEGKPMSALKLAQYIGMPRPTAMRKLAELQALGLIQRPTRSKYTFGILETPSPVHARVIAALDRRVRDASTELSRLDT